MEKNSKIIPKNFELIPHWLIILCNTRVPDLDMIIDLKTVKFQQFESEEDKIGK